MVLLFAFWSVYASAFFIVILERNNVMRQVDVDENQETAQAAGVSLPVPTQLDA
jgi:hypothetical protein